MNTTAIKTFIAAHKTAISICVVVLVIGSKSFTQSFEQGFNDSYYGQQNHQNQYGPNPQQQQQPQQNQGFFSRWFGGNNAYQPQNNQGYANQGYANQQYYPQNSGNYTPANNSGADYTSGYAAQQASLDRTSANYSDYIRDQANYEDANGNVYKLNSNYSNNYINNTTGEAVQSNDANYDPNAYSTSSYSALTPTNSYSSSYSSPTVESAE
ncbi:MAG: hypothetical protein U0U67_09835 [Chitinophagales bacterium]